MGRRGAGEAAESSAFGSAGSRKRVRYWAWHLTPQSPLPSDILPLARSYLLMVPFPVVPQGHFYSNHHRVALRQQLLSTQGLPVSTAATDLDFQVHCSFFPLWSTYLGSLTPGFLSSGSCQLSRWPAKPSLCTVAKKQSN